MKLFLFKLGKIWKTLRQQGLLQGGKRVWNYVVIYFRHVFKFNLGGDILIIGTGVGDVGHFRIFTQAEEFNLHGIKTAVTLQDNPFLLRLAPKFKVFILVRPIYTPKMESFWKKLKELEKTIIFDTDDLVFDAKFMHATESYQKMNALEKKQYEKGVGEEIIRDPALKYCSTSTTYLKKILEDYGKKVFLNTNKISLHELKVAETINSLRENPLNQKCSCGCGCQPKKVRLGYFSGTMSHNKDFATITPALMKIMEKYPRVELVLVGALETENKLNKFESRIVRIGLAPRDKHYENLSRIDINLIPLVSDDPFTESKSELKYFEAGIVKVPSVAQDNETYRGCIIDGADGFLAKNQEEWIEKLEKLILDKTLRQSMGKKAYEKSLEDYTVKNSHNKEYYDFLRSKI